MPDLFTESFTWRLITYTRYHDGTGDRFKSTVYCRKRDPVNFIDEKIDINEYEKTYEEYQIFLMKRSSPDSEHKIESGAYTDEGTRVIFRPNNPSSLPKSKLTLEKRSKKLLTLEKDMSLKKQRT